MAAEPIGPGFSTARDSAVADQSRPVGQDIRSRDRAGRELMAQGGPRFQIRSKLQGDVGDVQQHRLTPFLHRQADQLRRVRAGRTQQLSRHAELVQAVCMLLQTQGDADFLVRYAGIFRRQRRIKTPLVVSRTPSHGNLEKPFRQAATSAADSCQAKSQAGKMSRIAQCLAERSGCWLVL